MTEETNALPRGFSLHRYQIDGVLGAGGFGITYRAVHEALENEVAIKEYFPAEWAYRDHNGTTVRPNAQGQIPAKSGEPPSYDWGLQRFLDEAKILVQINHPCVVRVRDYFTANGSAYIVMEFEEGESMSALLQRGGILPEGELRRLLADVLPALEAVHGQGYLHRDLKPSNLYMRKADGHVMLIDFGAARQALGRRSRSVTSVVTPGYSPIEQYVTVGEDYGPWTDIYALGAVLYRCITGAPPVEAPGRVLKDPVQPAIEAGAGLYSHNLLQMVDRALAVRPEDRFQSIAAMQEALWTAERSNAKADFSEVPPIQPELLDFSEPLDIAGLEPLADGTPSSPSARPDPSENDVWSGRTRVSRRPSQPQTTDSRPSQRVDLAAFTPNGKPNWTFADPTSTSTAPSAPQEAANTDSTSMNLLEDIWDHLEEPASEPKPTAMSEPQTNAAEIESLSLANQTSTLLNRAPGSAIEHLRKATATRREVLASTRLTQLEASSLPGSSSVIEPAASQRSSMFEPSARPSSARSVPEGSKSVNWTHVLLAAFAALGLSGAGLFAYEYYQNVQEQNRQEAVALQQREQEETDRHAQEAAQQREAEIARYLEQARQAIASRNWSLADSFLNRAATIDPHHPAVVTTRSELLAAQRPGAKITRTDNITGMELHWVDGGCFDMGSLTNERDRGSDESSHQVCVKGFWIGNTEVTNNQYRRFKPGHDSGSFQGRPLNGNQQPVVQVDWGDAGAFAEWLSWEAGTGKRFRLPTEAEWEYAARAGTVTRYHWGNDIDPRYANFSDRNDPTGASIGTLDDGQAVTAPVGTYQPNALGLRDMAGNVWEWTCSDYDPAYTGKEQRCSDQRPTEGLRVVRGGSWNSGAGDVRSAKRMPRKPSYRDATTGFRIVMEE
ncbi:hypothetical protein E4P82_15710 [Candidatus Competibacter phosphatis]|uniref:Protein kinase domain-containing protein n=1 Tax=Candidatus Competibacter phosphatis TaxID=221280 RepID=A0ABX1TM68_9GAMM|nr:bifunctional serine/threonine-protein kinase/formylglycine-generating enzyme family protein [Candidatus Competibacter phosphatis]NMQ20512.1 hypothetical protein [Candidatus Competibacter phosphatis]